MDSTLFLINSLINAVHHPLAVLVAIAVGLVTMFYFRYQKAIQRRIKQVEEESWVFGMGITMTRNTSKERDSSVSSTVFSKLRLLELNPSFRTKHKNDWNMISLGEYLASLRPAPLPKPLPQSDIPQIIQREIEAGMAAALLKALGPNVGRALLPTIGWGPAQSMAAGLASRWFVKKEGASISRSDDRGGWPVSLMMLLAMSDANAKMRRAEIKTEEASRPTTELKVSTKLSTKENEEKTLTSAPAGSAMEKMLLGEIGYSPSFVDSETRLLPNPFVLFRDFSSAIKNMEGLIRRSSDGASGQSTRDLQTAKEEMLEDTLLQQDLSETESLKPPRFKDQYDPNSTKMADPVPINPRLFPGLHLGLGGVQCSHTNREVLKNRLLSVLLNKLGANYSKRIKGETDLFHVQLEDKKVITTPSELVQALIDSGHEVEVVPSCQSVSFGIFLCVLEDDESWSQIPLAAFLESGYEDSDGMAAPAFMPHSGLNMEVSGPLLGNRVDGTLSKCSIQHYIAIDGLCGWQSNHNPLIPWAQPVACGTPVKGKDAIRATRLAALHANVLNGIATDMDLPFGGYGLTAVCNDSAAVIQQCLYGTSTIYPMTSIGRFMQLTMQYAKRFRNKVKDMPNMEMEVVALCDLVKAMRDIPSDINASPANAVSAAKRMIHCLPCEMPFMMMEDTKKVMLAILREEEAEVEANEVLNASSFS
jgi:hypothetical protein